MNNSQDPPLDDDDTEAVRIFAESPKAPDLDVSEQHKSYLDDARNYQKALDHQVDVHSWDSLESSRAYCLRLLNAMSEQYPRMELSNKLAAQEIKLQESIRIRSYSDSEIIAKVRRALAYLVGFGSFFLGLYLAYFALSHTVEPQIYDTTVSFAKWMIGSSLGVVLAFYFPRLIRLPAIANRHENDKDISENDT